MPSSKMVRQAMSTLEELEEKALTSRRLFFLPSSRRARVGGQEGGVGLWEGALLGGFAWKGASLHCVALLCTYRK
jgi:hypothetical protein